jgi:hypothetical protein
MTETLDRSPGLADAVGAGTDAVNTPTPAAPASAPSPAPAASAKAEKAATAAEKKGRRRPLAPRRSKQHEREFIPTDKHPVFEMELPLKTEPASKVFENTFEPAQKTFFMLQVILPKTSLKDKSVLESVMEYVEGKFSELETEMTQTTDRLLVLKQDAGARSARQYFHAEMLTVQVMTPLFERFLALIIRMDELMQLVDSLWFARRLNDKQRAEVINQWRNRLVKFNREVFLLKERARTYADKIRETAKTKEEQKTARAAERLQKARVKEAAKELAEASAVRGSDMADIEKGLPSAA